MQASSPSPQKIVCVVAAQRAGTTALQGILARSGAMRNFGEIFQDPMDAVSPSATAGSSFFAFARLHDIRLADSMKKKIADEIAERYIASLREAAKDKHVLVDIKLNSWMALSPAWVYAQDEPFFMQHLKRHGATFIFVWRANLVEQVLSMAISRKLGIWHNIDAEKVDGRTFKATIKKIQKDAKLICLGEAAMHEHLADYDNKIEIAYEDLFRDGKLSDSFVSAFRTLTGIAVSTDSPTGIRRNSVDKSRIVTNYSRAASTIDEVQARYRSDLFRPTQG